MFMWTPQTLECQIYENNVLINLKKYTDDEIRELISCISSIWKTSRKSEVWFNVDVYEKYHTCYIPTRTMEVSCHFHSPNSFRNRKQVTISQTNYYNKFGKKFLIEPKNTASYTWTHPVEVAFVA